MGTGKSTVGKRVAAIVGIPYFDLDHEVERDAGMSIAELFAARGEQAFRELEGVHLRRILSSGSPSVVSLGGGALLRRSSRLDALDHAVIVTLDAPAAEIHRRTASAATRPLLQAPDPLARIEQLLDDRRVAYSECHARISTVGRSVESVAQSVIDVWKRDPIVVAAGTASYSVDIGFDIAPKRLAEVIAGASLTVLVTDSNVKPHHADALEMAIDGAGVRRATVVLAPGEAHKNVASLEEIWREALRVGADRKSRFVALGGGVVCDVTGFAASTFMRGVAWISVPTTLLSMVDASVGGKTAVDLGDAKNAVGTFWQPRAVLCDIRHVGTEPVRGYVSALAEIVKTALIGDPDLLSLVEEHVPAIQARDAAILSDIVRRCVRVKARVVSLDEREDGIRAWLNLGHTIGHALEAYGGYGALFHGEAVSLGLVAALRIGERLGMTDSALSARCIRALEKLGLPVDLRAHPLSDAVALIGHDKKRAGAKIRFVAARAPGTVQLVELSLDELRAHALSLS